MSSYRRRSGLLAFALVVGTGPAWTQAQALPAPPAAAESGESERREQSGKGGPWRVDLETGFRAQGTQAYRGIYLAPGLWFEIQPGLRVGLFAPLHIRTSPMGRVGMGFSFGLEPRIRIAITDNVSGEIALGLAAENRPHVEGVSSYGAGLQLGEVMNIRYTHERYSLSPSFYDAGGEGDASANFIDLAFTGGAGQRLAHAEVLVFLLLAAVTAGAR